MGICFMEGVFVFLWGGGVAFISRWLFRLGFDLKGLNRLLARVRKPVAVSARADKLESAEFVQCLIDGLLGPSGEFDELRRRCDATD